MTGPPRLALGTCAPVTLVKIELRKYKLLLFLLQRVPCLPKCDILTLSLYPIVSPFPPEWNPSKSLKIPLLRQRTATGLLHDDVILLPSPESFRIFFLLQIRPFFYINLTEITEFNKRKGKTKRILVIVVK